jgi:hypothetical protein
MDDLTYQFNCLQIPYGDAFIEVNGTATYQIEDLSSGERGDQEELQAFFYKAKIRSYDTEVEDPMQGLTKQDLVALEQVVLDALNDNYELCTTRPTNPKA